MKKKNENPWESMNEKLDEVLGDKFWKDMLPVLPRRIPLMDIFETELEGTVVLELPGLASTEDIGLQVKNNQLLIKGKIPYPYPISKENLIQSERFFGEFKRAIPLPFSVIPQKLQALYKNGILYVTFQKNTEDMTVEIDFSE
ncbi:Spore coat protein P [Bacillus sp. THAF10]|uniref:Hsp20/alpha crystallin family protein n=1 Tax=Bacillus sp. THAF10 TaxID=2587848 RepID=UPI0012A927FC|nr:Hsp20/alpha crystallin family protein [Bacillus sp. THAF10]QFT88585.1 Spore coat protein P [Bacillus sp. THAF10]